jgi:hypothetical protein
MVGESHGLVFSNLLFRPEWSQESYLCRTRFFPSLQAAQYADEAKVSHEYIEGLIADGIVDSSLRPAFLHAEPSAAFLAGMPVMAPAMVLFAGDLDMHQLFRLVGNGNDFLLPDDPGYGLDQSKQMLTYADVRDHILAFLTPFFTAVEQLQAVGFSRMMIHCLPPRTPDNAAASRWTSSLIVDAPVRAKLTLVANRLIAKFCESSDIPFINTWPELTTNGYLKPEFELDGAHVNRQSALISLGKIAGELFDRTVGIWNAARYALAASEAQPRQRSDYASEWDEAGLVVGRLNADFARRALETLSFDLGRANVHARPDWIGRPRTGCEAVTLAEPPQSLLAEAAALLAEGEENAILHAGAAQELTVVSFRPIRYAATAHDIAPLAAPPQTRRAVIFLKGTDRLTIETLEGDALGCPAFAAGDFMVFDPHRIDLRVQAGSDDMSLIELALVPRLPKQPFRVLWSGLCDWPADPYCFSVQGMTAFPELKGGGFRARPTC